MERANKYIYKVYQTKSFSLAAKELYISQPSLSATVKKRENELGFEIFDRRTSPLSLTREGKIYIDYLDEAMINEKNMMRRVKLLSNLSHEKLVVIGTNFLSYKIIPKIFGILRKKYPHVEMTANFGSGYPKKELYSMLESGSANLMINYTCNESKFDYIPLHKEKFVVAVRRDGITDERLFSFAVPYSEIVTDTVKEERIISDYSLFKNVEFLRVSKNSSIQSYVHKFIENASVSSCHIYNSNTLEEHYYMMENGLGAVITTDYLIKNIPENKDVLYFITDFRENCRQAKILYNKNTSLSNSAKAFVEIAKEMLTKK